MQLPISLKKLQHKFPVVGLTAKPKAGIRTWYGEKYGWNAALIHEVRSSNIDAALECRLKGVTNGVEFDFWEFSDNLEEKIE